MSKWAILLLVLLACNAQTAIVTDSTRIEEIRIALDSLQARRDSISVADHDGELTDALLRMYADERLFMHFTDSVETVFAHLADSTLQGKSNFFYNKVWNFAYRDSLGHQVDSDSLDDRGVKVAAQAQKLINRWDRVEQYFKRLTYESRYIRASRPNKIATVEEVYYQLFTTDSKRVFVKKMFGSGRHFQVHETKTKVYEFDTTTQFDNALANLRSQYGSSTGAY